MKHAATPPETDAPSAAMCLGAVVRLLIRALKALDEAGQNDLACRIAGEAWSAIRRTSPREAERFNGLLHSLSNTRNSKDHS